MWWCDLQHACSFSLFAAVNTTILLFFLHLFICVQILLLVNVICPFCFRHPQAQVGNFRINVWIFASCLDGHVSESCIVTSCREKIFQFHSSFKKRSISKKSLLVHFCTSISAYQMKFKCFFEWISFSCSQAEVYLKLWMHSSARSVTAFLFCPRQSGGKLPGKRRKMSL